ncbi:MAG: histidine phosphatase family protein [Gammaproteobacteria bacterium]
MQRQLTLLRHAKASWEQPSATVAELPDHDRPLNEQGERDAPIMGQRLRQRGARPTLFLTSPAVRARQTARIVAREIGFPQEFLQRELDLYLATPEQILAVLARQESSFRDVIVCGHNPGLTDLANRLTGAGIDNIPTAGIVVIELPTHNWADIGQQRAELLLFDYPRRRPLVSDIS